MDTTKITEIAHGGVKTLVKHSPKLLTAAGIAGFFTTVIFAVNAKPKADLLIDEAKALKADEEGVPQEERSSIKLTPFETFKAVTPAYWPTAVSFILSSAAVIGSDYISDKRQTALSAAYTIADMSLKEYQKKTIEKFGEKKAGEIEAAVTRKKLENTPVDDEVKRFASDNTSYTIFMAPMTGQIFSARIEDVKECFIRANHAINNCQEVMLNDLLYDFNTVAVNIANHGRGVSETDVGNIFYWEANGELIKYHFSAAKIPDTEIPCLEIVLDTKPRCCYESKSYTIN